MSSSSSNPKPIRKRWRNSKPAGNIPSTSNVHSFIKKIVSPLPIPTLKAALLVKPQPLIQTNINGNLVEDAYNISITRDMNVENYERDLEFDASKSPKDSSSEDEKEDYDNAEDYKDPPNFVDKLNEQEEEDIEDEEDEVVVFHHGKEPLINVGNQVLRKRKIIQPSEIKDDEDESQVIIDKEDSRDYRPPRPTRRRFKRKQMI